MAEAKGSADAPASPAVLRHRARTRSGVDAEERAARLLEADGFAILARRLRTPAGEIDLIARRAGLLVFCEVKLRATRDDAAYAVLPRQRRRIAAAAEAFLTGHPELGGLDMRFDAILLARDGSIEHLPGAFEADG